MTITWGLGLQAIGIILEGVGLMMAFRFFGSVSERRRKAHAGLDPLNIYSDKYEKEGREFGFQLLIIGIGLAFQLVGLFIP